MTDPFAVATMDAVISKDADSFGCYPMHCAKRAMQSLLKRTEKSLYVKTMNAFCKLFKLYDIDLVKLCLSLFIINKSFIYFKS